MSFWVNDCRQMTVLSIENYILHKAWEKKVDFLKQLQIRYFHLLWTSVPDVCVWQVADLPRSQMSPCVGDSWLQKTSVQSKQETAGRLLSFHIWWEKNNKKFRMIKKTSHSKSIVGATVVPRLIVAMSTFLWDVLHTYWIRLVSYIWILPGVSDKQHRLAKSKCPSYQHSQSPHAVCPHNMAKLLWNSSNAVDEGTCQSEHQANIILCSFSLFC